MSKKFLEERVEIRRNVDEAQNERDGSRLSSLQGGSNNGKVQEEASKQTGNYSLHINFGKERIGQNLDNHMNMDDMDMDNIQDFEAQDNSNNFYQ